jgi:hypothetical protein
MFEPIPIINIKDDAEGISPDPAFLVADKINSMFAALAVIVNGMASGCACFVRTDFIGGAANALDSIACASVEPGAVGLVIKNGQLSAFVLETAHSEAEDSPNNIIPDGNPGGGKQWILKAQTLKIGTGAADACAGNDAKLFNARTPTSHQHPASDIADFFNAVMSAIRFGTGPEDVCRGSDSRLFDARPPTGHAHATSDITSFSTAVAAIIAALVGATTGTICAGDDSRLLTSALAAALAGSHGTPGSGNEFVTTTDPRIGGSTAQLENSLVMMAFDMYGVDTTFADMNFSDFDADNIYVTGSSGYTYNAGGKYYENTKAVADNQQIIEIADTTSVVRQNLAGGITQWVKGTNAYQGCFYNATRPVSVGAGNESPNVIVGIRIQFADNSIATVTAISGDGTNENTGVTLDVDHATGNIAGIYGTTVTGGNLTVNQALDPDGANNASTTAINLSGGTASDNRHDGTDSAAHAFDTLTNNAYYNTAFVTGDYIQIDCGTAKCFNKWQFKTYNSGSAYQPKRLKIRGSADGSNWTDLDTQFVSADMSSYGLGVLTNWATFKNATAYRYYRIEFISLFSGTTVAIMEWYFVENATLVTPSGLYAAVTDSPLQVNTSAWSAIAKTSGNVVAATETKPGTSAAWYAVSKNKGNAAEKWSVYLSSVWRDIVQLSSGTWQYKDAGGSWQSATVNDQGNALAQAFAISQNQMSGTALAAITNAQWATYFVAGTFDVAFGLQANAANIPLIDKLTGYYSTAIQNMIAVLPEWDASANDPSSCYTVIAINPVDSITMGTDLKVFVSMNNGSNYEEITGLALFRTVGSYQFFRGDKAGLTARGAKQMLLKVQTYNLKNIRLKAAALGVKY